MPVVATEIAKAPTDRQLRKAIKHRILELDDDVTELKIQRERGDMHPRVAAQISRLIKLLNATIEELQAAL